MPLADDYFAALTARDSDRMLDLFAPGGVVHSPLWGVVPAADFYPMLFSRTSHASTQMRRVFTAPDGSSAFWFDYVWTLPDGSESTVNAVDVVELDDAGRIRQIFIVYDTGALDAGFADKARGSGS